MAENNKKKDNENKKASTKKNNTKSKTTKSTAKKDIVKETVIEQQDNKVNNNVTNEKTRILMILIISAAFVCVIIGLLVAGKSDEKTTTKEEAATAASFAEFEDTWQDDDVSIIYFMSSECGFCEMETPILEEIASDYNFDYLKIDATQLSKDELSEVIELLGIEGSTPTTVIVQNEKVLATQQGYLDGHDYVNFFINGGILNSDAIYEPEQYLTFIDFEEYKELVDSKNLQVITIGQTACSYCAATRPILSEIANEYSIQINYLDLRRISQDEQTEFFEMLDDMEYDEETYVEEGKFGTPLTVITKNGKIVSYVNGAQSKDDFVSAFKDAGIIED